MYTALIPLFALALNVLVQVLGFRFLPGLGLLNSIIAGFAVGLASTLVSTAYVLFSAPQSPHESISLMLVNAIIFSALGYGYFHFVNLGETARRIRLLIELSEAGEGLALDEVLSRYSTAEMVRKRLERLIANGQVIQRGGRYFTGRPTMLWISRSISAMKLIVLGKRSGL
jgi:hypothetical protein